MLAIHDTDGPRVTVELTGHDWTGQTLLSHRFTVTTNTAHGSPR